MQRVDLWDEGVGVIWRGKTGVLCSNQANGMLCDHPEVEGSFEAMPDKTFDGSEFHDDICTMWCSLSADSDAAVIERIDEALREFGLKVDLEYLDELQEAWIPVVDGAGRHGVFLYENCD